MEYFISFSSSYVLILCTFNVFVSFCLGFTTTPRIVCGANRVMSSCDPGYVHVITHASHHTGLMPCHPPSTTTRLPTCSRGQYLAMVTNNCFNQSTCSGGGGVETTKETHCSYDHPYIYNYICYPKKRIYALYGGRVFLSSSIGILVSPGYPNSFKNKTIVSRLVHENTKSVMRISLVNTQGSGAVSISYDESTGTLHVDQRDSHEDQMDFKLRDIVFMKRMYSFVTIHRREFLNIQGFILEYKIIPEQSICAGNAILSEEEGYISLNKDTATQSCRVTITTGYPFIRIWVLHQAPQVSLYQCNDCIHIGSKPSTRGCTQLQTPEAVFLRSVTVVLDQHKYTKYNMALAYQGTDGEHTVMCDGSHWVAGCPPGQGIVILGGNYGRTSGQVCESSDVTGCMTQGTSRDLQNMCPPRTSKCDITVPMTTTTWQNTCVDTPKYMNLHHVCLQPNQVQSLCGGIRQMRRGFIIHVANEAFKEDCVGTMNNSPSQAVHVKVIDSYIPSGAIYIKDSTLYLGIISSKAGFKRVNRSLYHIGPLHIKHSWQDSNYDTNTYVLLEYWVADLNGNRNGFGAITPDSLMQSKSDLKVVFIGLGAAGIVIIIVLMSVAIRKRYRDRSKQAQFLDTDHYSEIEPGTQDLPTHEYEDLNEYPSRHLGKRQPTYKIRKRKLPPNPDEIIKHPSQDDHIKEQSDCPKPSAVVSRLSNPYSEPEQRSNAIYSEPCNISPRSERYNDQFVKGDAMEITSEEYHRHRAILDVRALCVDKGRKNKEETVLIENDLYSTECKQLTKGQKSGGTREDYSHEDDETLNDETLVIENELYNSL